MSRTRRLLVVAAAWAVPIAWAAVALLSGPSDGTSISPAGAMLGAHPWGETVTVVRTYGDTPLRDGDVIIAIDGRAIDSWVTDPPGPSTTPEATIRSTGSRRLRLRSRSRGEDHDPGPGPGTAAPTTAKLPTGRVRDDVVR